ncbi:MAG: putative transcriptional regulator [Clostridiales bacterium]|jgi:DNA-binding transcriptional MerR regulator|nr:putative transcriptional regulator [Clostridiales bacterium]
MRNAGLPIEALIEYVTLFQQGDETVEARKELLTEQRKNILDKIEDMKKTLERLDKKIEGYERNVMKKEKGLKKS